MYPELSTEFVLPVDAKEFTDKQNVIIGFWQLSQVILCLYYTDLNQLQS